jgi:double-GTPase-like protein
MQFLAAIALFAAWAGTMFVGFAFVFPVVFAATLIAATAFAVGHYYVYACRALVPAPADGPSPVERPAPTHPRRETPPTDPAYRHYLLVQVWRDWWAITRGIVPRVTEIAVGVLTATTRTLVGGLWGFFTFPLWLAICAGIVLAAIPAALLGLLLTLLYGIIVAAGLAGWLVCVLLLAAIERVFMAYGRILQTCPHPFCYEKVSLPMYECPSCGELHRRLIPGALGALRHVCRCGTRLPTTIPLGRFRLTAYCPHCNGRLPDRIGRVRVEPLPIIGGPDAGKTTFMFLAIRALHAQARAGRGSVAFVERRHAQAYAGAVREFQRGGRLAKTGPELPLATMVDVDLPRAGRRILYLFDPAGEHFTGATMVESLRYLDHGEALLFVLDPFALPQVRRMLTERETNLIADALGTAPGPAAAGEDPTDTLQRVLNELRSRPDQGRQKRIAVVVTKADLLSATTIGRHLRDPGSGEAVRAWLDGLGLGNAIRMLDHLATEVRYFGSGLDTAPVAVADVLGWVVGLPVDRAADPAAVPADPGQEVPGIAPLRAPWKAAGRDSALVPASYQAGRWAVLGGLSLLTITALASTAFLALRILG